METAVPRGKEEVLPGKYESRCQVQGVEATKLPLDRQSGRVLDQILVDLDDAKCWPLIPEGSDGRCASRQANRPGDLDKAHATDKPAAGGAHCLSD